MAPSASNKDAIDEFVRGLKYEPKELLATVPNGDTEAQPAKSRDSDSDAVIITTTTKHSLSSSLSDIAILRPTAGAVFPGAVVLADEAMMDGQPTPVTVQRAPLRLSIDLPGLNPSSGLVDNPTTSGVQEGIETLLRAWNAQPGSEGYVNAARSYTERTTAFSSQQAALNLKINAKWAEGQASSQLDVNQDSTTSTAMAFYKQVFYTVTIDTPPTPSAFFGSDVKAEDIQAVASDQHPLAYVRSVDYGRLVMIKMATSESQTGVDLKVALQVASEGGASGGADLDAKYKSVLKNSTFQVLALGGGSGTAAEFTGAESDLIKLSDYIKKDATYRRDNPGAPISYNVAFMKDNSLATMGFTTDYTEKSSVRYPNGWVGLWHDGGYVAKFEVSWVENDASGEPVSKQWSSGKTTAGFTHKVPLPGDASKVRIYGLVDTGLAWNVWQAAIDETVSGPTRKWYRIFGTTLTRKWDDTKNPGT